MRSPAAELKALDSESRLTLFTESSSMLDRSPRPCRTYFIARCAVASLSLTACALHRPSPGAEQAVSRSSVSTILREASFEDPDLAAHNRGRLEIVVRSTDRPTQVLPGAQVLVLMNPRDTLRRITDEGGLARFDSLAVGDHELVVRRLGYGVARGIVPVKPGCRTDSEVYISISMLGIAPPPPMPSRVAITTCR